jgi:hypothetical protein
MSARFGTQASIHPDRWATLPAAMQREGALMLIDMGLSDAAVTKRLGLTAPEFDRLVNLPLVPYRRGGEATLAGDVE